MKKTFSQFSQTEGVKVVDAATQTEVEETLRQVEDKKSVQTEEKMVELKSLADDELSTQQQTEAEVMELEKTLDKKKPNQTVEGVEKTLSQEDDRKLTKSTAKLRKVEKLDQKRDDEETGSRYVLLVKKGAEVRKRGENKEVQGREEEEEQGMEVEDKELQVNEEHARQEKVEQKEEESGTIYSYAITEGKNMKKGDTTTKHCPLFH